MAVSRAKPVGVPCIIAMCYNGYMDTTIRNLDAALYRKLRARATLTGMTVGEAVSEAMRAYLARPEETKTGSLTDLVPQPFPAGNERLSEQVDAVVYESGRARG